MRSLSAVSRIVRGALIPTVLLLSSADAGCAVTPYESVGEAPNAPPTPPPPDDEPTEKPKARSTEESRMKPAATPDAGLAPTPTEEAPPDLPIEGETPESPNP